MHDDPNYFGQVVSLPMEAQNNDPEWQNRQFEKQKAIARGKYVPEPFENRPLTTDVVARGYPPTRMELDTVRHINECEKALLEQGRVPVRKGFRYYITEQGQVFMTQDFGIYYELDLDNMIWRDEPKYMSIMFDTFIRFSELKNMRDYYPIPEEE